MAILKNTTVSDTGFVQLPLGAQTLRPANPLAGMFRYNTDEDALEFYNGTSWIILKQKPFRLVNGLAGKFFNGSWRSTISTGNIGTLPLTTDNDSSNVSGTAGLPGSEYRSGVNLWPFIDFGNGLGDNYGFIAIGYFKPPASGTYTVYTASDDGSGVWIGSIASADSGRTGSNATLNNNLGGGQGVVKRSDTISLTADTYYPIRIVMEEAGGGDALRYTWAGPGISEREDLTEYYFSPVLTETDGLVGDYIDDNMNDSKVENF